MHHGEGLRRLLDAAGKTEEENSALLAALGTDHASADLEDRDRVILDYAAKLTRTPEAIDSGDVEALRGHGFDDRAIHDICAITAYYAFVNRIADGLGVEVEDGRGA